MGTFTLQNASESIRKSARDSIRYHRENAERRLKALDNTVLARCLLASEGFTELECYSWQPDEVTLTLADGRDLVRVRRALETPLKATGAKEPVERSRNKVWVTVKAAEFPGLTIRYKAKMKNAGKCRVVVQRRTTYSRRLVCDA